VAPGGEFYCATHVRPLRDAGVSLEEDPERLAEFIVYDYVSAPRTLFKGVDQLMAGERRRFRLNGSMWRLERSERFAPPRPAAAAAREESGGRYGTYGRRACDAVTGAMRALSPASGTLHVLLSGGLDSSILYQIAKSDLGVASSYSTGYPFEDEARNVEKQYALSAAEALGARHRFYVPTTEQFLRGFLEAVAAAEQPLVLLQSVLLLLLFRDGLPPGPGTVVMGQGADGVFGLRIHRTVEKVDRFRKNHPRLSIAFHPALWSVAGPVLNARLVAPGVRGLLKLLRREHALPNVLRLRWGDGAPPSHPRHILWALGVTGDERWARRRFGASRQQVISNRAAAVAPYADRSTLDQLSLLDFLSDVSITQSIWSKLGEAAGKSVYYPFNDPAVLDCAFSTPWDLKLAEPKGLLRDVARRLEVPEFIITRPKAGFSITTARWASPGAVLDPLVPLAAKVWGEPELRRMQSGQFNRAHTFWAMLNYAVWKRMFIDGESLDTLMDELERSMADSNAVAASPAAAAVA